MKKILCILIFLVQVFSYSQESSFGVTGGYTTNGYAAQIGYYKTLSNSGELQVTLYASNAEDKKEFVNVPYNDISLNVGYLHKVLQDRYNKFHFALGGGALIGYEILNKGENVLENGALIDGESKLLYGGFISSELAYYISDTTAITAVLNEFYHINSDIGKTLFYGGLGIRISIN